MILPLAFFAAALLFPVPDDSIKNAFGERDGAFVMMDCASKETVRRRPEACQEKLPPCSTFKIWNTAIGFEEGILSSPDQPFWTWDGQRRSIEAWNKNLTLKEAFAASCVPAFQALARQIGAARMKDHLDKIGCGDRDISSGIDVFWLPAPGRKTLLISPDEQAQLLCKLVEDKLPFSPKTLSALKEIMTVKKTERGVLYGKTGTGEGESGKNNLGWFVGYVETATGKTFTFACAIKGEGAMGKDARAVVERILSEQGLL
jgi:beta-lactamase class D